jgi:hypothetical protein
VRRNRSWVFRIFGEEKALPITKLPQDSITFAEILSQSSQKVKLSPYQPLEILIVIL